MGAKLSKLKIEGERGYSILYTLLDSHYTHSVHTDALRAHSFPFQSGYTTPLLPPAPAVQVIESVLPLCLSLTKHSQD